MLPLAKAVKGARGAIRGALDASESVPPTPAADRVAASPKPGAAPPRALSAAALGQPMGLFVVPSHISTAVAPAPALGRVNHTQQLAECSMPFFVFVWLCLAMSSQP